MLSSTLALVSLALPALVSAHGFVNQVTIDGKAYKGRNPWESKGDSIIRKVSNVEPVKGTDNKDLACGRGASPAAKSATAHPGSKISFKWTGGGNSNWPHEYGPLMFYMADCNGPCEEFNAANAKWFKIDQVGRKDGKQNDWVQKDLMSGKEPSVKLPDNLISGNYLIRHEIISLHEATNWGGAEFYPSCTQLKVEGDGWAKPENTISLPGAYKADEKGILIHVWTAKGDYPFPGGKLAKMVGSDSNPEPAPSSSKSSTPTGKPEDNDNSNDDDEEDEDCEEEDDDESPPSPPSPTPSPTSTKGSDSTPTSVPTSSKETPPAPKPTGSNGSEAGFTDGGSDKPKGDDKLKDDSKSKGDDDKPKDDPKDEGESDEPFKMPVRQRPCAPPLRRSLLTSRQSHSSRFSRHRLVKMH